MTTHLTSWSKMSFQKKSKATASVGNPSPKSLARSKSSRVTKSEVKVDPDNNNSQESLEQENNSSADSANKKLDVEGESPQSNTLTTQTDVRITLINKETDGMAGVPNIFERPVRTFEI